DFDIDLTLTPLGETDGVHLLAARASELRRHSLALLGTDALPDDESAIDAFAASEALVEIDQYGKVRAIYYSGDPPAAFKYVMQRLLSALDFTMPEAGAREWTAEEAGPNGRARVRYAMGSDSQLMRTRDRYESLALLEKAPCPGCDA